MKDWFNLESKVAIVTGGNRGIGKQIARGLASMGADIVIVSRDEALSVKAAAEVKEEFGHRVMAIKCDVKEVDHIQTMVSQVLDTFGKIDILVNNAGRGRRKLPQDFTIEEWDEVHNTNTRSVWLCSKAVYPAMKKAGGGKIINIASINSGHPFGMAYGTAYCSSKGGVIGITKSTALAWAQDNIQVNAINPGWIDTEITVGARRDVPGLNEKVLARAPLARWGKPEEIAGTAMFLASAASDFVTGIDLPVDGGYSIQLL